MTTLTETDLWGRPTNQRRDRMTVDFVTSLVALNMDVPAREIASRRRCAAAVVRARHVAIYLSHVVLSWPLWRVAEAFGRDRTTAGHAVRVIEDLRDDQLFDARVARLEDCLRQATGSDGDLS